MSMQNDTRYESVDTIGCSEDSSPESKHVTRSPRKVVVAFSAFLGFALLLSGIAATWRWSGGSDNVDDDLVEGKFEVQVHRDDVALESTGLAPPSCRCTAYRNGASANDTSLCMATWGGPNSPCLPTARDGKCPSKAKRCTTTSPPAPAPLIDAVSKDDSDVQNDIKPCLCAFDVDRTLTANLGSSKADRNGKQLCEGTSLVPGAIDHGFGTGTLTLSAAATAGINSTACGNCFLGVVSYGSAGNQYEKQVLAEKVLNSQVFQDLAEKHPETRQFTYGIHIPALSPLVLHAPDRRKQWAVEGILAWYWSKNITIPRDRVFFFDDRADNALYFEGTNFNAHQISCQSRDRSMVGFCGATVEEFNLSPGVSDCKRRIASNSSKPTHHTGTLRGTFATHKLRPKLVDQRVTEASV